MKMKEKWRKRREGKRERECGDGGDRSKGWPTTPTVARYRR